MLLFSSVKEIFVQRENSPTQTNNDIEEPDHTMKFLKYLLPLAAGVLLLQGCASKSESSEAAGNFPFHATGKARVYIYSTAALAADTVVKLDGAKVGTAKANGSFYVDTTPGEHTVAASDGKPVSFHLDNGGNGFVRLDLVDGKATPVPVAAAEGQKAVTALGGTK